MSRVTDILAAGYIARHCTTPGCAKCIARARWYRRKARRSGQPRKNTNTERK